jgi:hypothetical protein
MSKLFPGIDELSTNNVSVKVLAKDFIAQLESSSLYRVKEHLRDEYLRAHSGRSPIQDAGSMQNVAVFLKSAKAEITDEWGQQRRTGDGEARAHIIAAINRWKIKEINEFMEFLPPKADNAKQILIKACFAPVQSLTLLEAVVFLQSKLGHDLVQKRIEDEEARAKITESATLEDYTSSMPSDTVLSGDGEYMDIHSLLE